MRTSLVINTQKEQTLSAVFKRATDVLAKLDSIAQDGTVYVYQRRCLTADWARTYAMLDKGANSLRDIDRIPILS